MNVQRNKEIKAVVTALTVAAALASGFLTARDANATPPSKKKSTVTVKRATKAKPVYVKMSGNRRAAEVRGQQLYSQALAQKAADEQAAAEARQAVVNEPTTVVTSNTAPQGGGYNPYGGFVQQVTVPGYGGQGPIVVGGGYGFGGITTVGGSNGFGSVGGFGFPGGGYVGNTSSVVGYPSSGPLFGGGLQFNF